MGRWSSRRATSCGVETLRAEAETGLGAEGVRHGIPGVPPIEGGVGVVEDGHQQVPVCPLGAAAALPLGGGMSVNGGGGRCGEGPLTLTLTLTDLFFGGHCYDWVQ